MKKILSVICLVILVFSACKETPSNEIVINKGLSEFDDKLAEKDSATFDSESMPDKLTMNISKYDGKLEINIDAEVIVENNKEYSVATIKPYYISQEQANKIVNALFGTTEVYFNSVDLSKEDIENLIIQVKADQQEAYTNSNEDKAKDLQETIDNLTEQLKDAPEKVELKPYNGEYEIYNDGSVEQLTLRRKPHDGETPILEIRNIKEAPYSNGYDSEVLYVNFARQTFIDSYDTGQGYINNPTFNSNEAKKAIENVYNFLESIDIKDVELDTIMTIKNEQYSNDISGYRMLFVRKYNNTIIPLFIQLGGTLANSYSEEYIKPFHSESLIVEIEGEEIMYFEWSNIYEEDTTINDSIELLPFEEIISNAENQLAAKYAYVNEQEQNYNIFIDKIMLTYAIEPIEDKKYEYMLIPVWAFYGGYDFKDGYIREDGAVLTGKQKELFSLLTVNAVDGTIIHGG